MAPQPIALESCSNPQKTRQVFQPAMKKIFGMGFAFWERHLSRSFLAAGPTTRWKYFTEVFIEN